MNQSLPPAQTNRNSDEIDLFELFELVWRQKWLVVAITFFVTACAFAYALLATPIYQTSSVLRPVPLKNLSDLNVTDIYTLTPDEALSLVGVNLESYSTRFEYFKKYPELFEKYIKPNESLEQSFERFNREAITIIRPDEKREGIFNKYVEIQVDYPKGVDGPTMTNNFVTYAIDTERDRIVENITTLIENKLKNIDSEINVLRSAYHTEKTAKIENMTEVDRLQKLNLEDELEALRYSLKNDRENRIQQLTEAITIARALGIKKPSLFPSLDTEIRLSDGVLKTESNKKQIPIYFMGTEALEAERQVLQSRADDDFTSERVVEIKNALRRLENNREIEILNARQNDDFFLDRLAEKRSEITRLNEVVINVADIQLVTIDQYATTPLAPIKPKRILIIAIGVVLGAMLGVFLALLVAMTRKRKAFATS